MLLLYLQSENYLIKLELKSEYFFLSNYVQNNYSSATKFVCDQTQIVL